MLSHAPEGFIWQTSPFLLSRSSSVGDSLAGMNAA